MPDKKKRVVIYLSPQTHQRLKVLLAIEGKTVTQWADEHANREIEEAGYEAGVED
jgi:hypothetical protein